MARATYDYIETYPQITASVTMARRCSALPFQTVNKTRGIQSSVFVGRRIQAKAARRYEKLSLYKEIRPYANHTRDENGTG